MYDSADEPIRPELVEAFDRAWRSIAAAGAWWDGAERVAIAACTRAARIDEGSEATGRGESLPRAAQEAAALLSGSPAAVTEAWVSEISEAIGQHRYVELVGVVAMVSAIDTFHRLTGRPLAALPEPQPGEPTQEPAPDGLRRNRTWVSMVMPLPPFVLGAVPSAMVAMNGLSEPLYMPHDEMGDPDWQRGELHRTQMELVAASTSHVNECFY